MYHKKHQIVFPINRDSLAAAYVYVQQGLEDRMHETIFWMINQMKTFKQYIVDISCSHIYISKKK